MKIETIYILLLNKGIDVWRPANAVKIKDNIHEILKDQPEFETEEENWEFKPGIKVRCKTKIINQYEVSVHRFSSH
jgi:hypothetical protein